MTMIIFAAIAIVTYAAGITIGISLCVAAARGDRMARHLLGSASSDKQEGTNN